MKESEQMGRNLNREKLHLVAVKGGSSRYEFKRSGRSGRSGTFKLFKLQENREFIRTILFIKMTNSGMETKAPLTSESSTNAAHMDHNIRRIYQVRGPWDHSFWTWSL